MQEYEDRVAVGQRNEARRPMVERATSVTADRLSATQAPLPKVDAVVAEMERLNMELDVSVGRLREKLDLLRGEQPEPVQEHDARKSELLTCAGALGRLQDRVVQLGQLADALRHQLDRMNDLA